MRVSGKFCTELSTESVDSFDLSLLACEPGARYSSALDKAGAPRAYGAFRPVLELPFC